MGIKIRMVTGDNINTALSIGYETGILSRRRKRDNHYMYEIMEGKKFREIIKGITYENPLGKTIEERGKGQVIEFETFKKVAQDLKVQ